MQSFEYRSVRSWSKEINGTLPGVLRWFGVYEVRAAGGEAIICEQNGFS